jgi:hypothetical protein
MGALIHVVTGYIHPNTYAGLLFVFVVLTYVEVRTGKVWLS